MTIKTLSVTFVVLLSSLPALAQQNHTPVSCPATEQAVRDIDRQIRSAFRNHDAATYDRLVDDNFISTNDGGVRERKQNLLRQITKPEGNIHVETDEPQDFLVVFGDGLAILNYTGRWTDYDKKAGVSWGATARVTRVLSCKRGEWKLLAFHETTIPNRDRQPATRTSDHLDDYVGHYRFGENGDKGELSIVRKGNRLFETWAGEEPGELLPGKYDTFFVRTDGWVASFVRDKSGKVTRILYTYADGAFEAKRVP
jgi:hypothetical protein